MMTASVVNVGLAAVVNFINDAVITVISVAIIVIFCHCRLHCYDVFVFFVIVIVVVVAFIVVVDLFSLLSVLVMEVKNGTAPSSSS